MRGTAACSWNQRSPAANRAVVFTKPLALGVRVFIPDDASRSTEKRPVVLRSIGRTPCGTWPRGVQELSTCQLWGSGAPNVERRGETASKVAHNASLPFLDCYTTGYGVWGEFTSSGSYASYIILTLLIRGSEHRDVQWLLGDGGLARPIEKSTRARRRLALP